MKDSLKEYEKNIKDLMCTLTPRRWNSIYIVRI